MIVKYAIDMYVRVCPHMQYEKYLLGIMPRAYNLYTRLDVSSVLTTCVEHMNWYGEKV